MVRLAGLGALVFVLLLSCGPLPREPRAVRPESDVCPECRMTVVPEGHAAQSVDGEGRVLVFDDPGCLALYAHDHAEELRDAAFFVQDVETKAWVPWEQAVLVRADEVPSPMNYGWHAFAEDARAQAFATRHGAASVLSASTTNNLYDDLKDRRWQP